MTCNKNCITHTHTRARARTQNKGIS